MRLTFWSVVVPFFLVGIGSILAPHPIGLYPHHPLFSLGAWWLCFGVPCAVIYWITRIARLAWTHGAPPPSAPEQINYTGPDTGRIFGKLN